MCHPPKVCALGIGRTRNLLQPHWPVTVRALAVPGQHLAPGSSLLHVGEENAHGVQDICFSCDSCRAGFEPRRSRCLG